MKTKNNHIVFYTSIMLLISVSSYSQSSEAWNMIFNGTDLSGWTIVDPPADVVVEDSSMVIHMTPFTSRHSFIRTNKAYKDFILELDFKRDKLIDSGVMFRCEAAPDSAYSALFGYMIKIDPRPQRLWTGGLFVDFGNGYNWLQTLEDNEKGRDAEKQEGEWNRLRVEAIGDDVKVWLNDVPTTHILDDRYKLGHIGFKIHYLQKANEEKISLKIAYKSIRILTKDLKKYARPSTLSILDTRDDLDNTYFR
ncbi:MAG: hypothetical protein ACI9GZ_001238 [Bacteroidia bacterium]|jgi:hypothetical protein